MVPVLRRAAVLTGFTASAAFAQTPAGGVASPAVTQNAQRRIDQVMSKVVAWRRDIHQHPELGNRETRTAARVAENLRKRGIEVKTGVAHHGVVSVVA